MYQVTQSVMVKNEGLAQFGHAGFVTKDNTIVVNGVAEGTVDVKMDADNQEYAFDVNDLKGL
jgi:hypothetical protein